MKAEIEEFKQRNGNNNFTTKEILMYIARRVEKIEDKLSSTQASQKYIWIGMAGLYAVVFFIIRHLLGSKV